MFLVLTTVLDITTELTSDNMISTYIPSTEFERTTSADQETANNTFLLMSTRDLANFISSVDYDITGCLINCTNNGKCKKNIISKKFECSCVEYYYGNDCRTSRRICTNEMQCLNSGTCIDMIEFNKEKNTFEFTYKCNCSEYYYGERCQYEVDLCKNITCSSNGFCKVNATKAAVCNCFKFYSGENCQIRSKELVMIKQVISVSSIIAIVVISVMFLTLVLNDISSLFIKKEMKKNVQGCEEEAKEITNTKELKYTC